MISANGKARAIGIILIGLEHALNFSLGDFLEPIGGNVLIVDDK